MVKPIMSGFYIEANTYDNIVTKAARQNNRRTLYLIT